MEVKSSDFSDVFVSYRRKDVEFTKQLVEELQKAGKECWIDWEDIPPGSVGFSDDIKRGLEGADAFIAILTPDYLESPYCMDMELKYAVNLKKKLIPIVLKKFDGYDIPADISHINWIYFTPHAGHENTFEESLPKVMQALDTDLEHVRTHKRLLLRALEWDTNERKASYLLRGNALTEAEAWLAEAPDKIPDPTELHTHFIYESRKAAAAQQRQLLVIASVAAVLMAFLAVFAGFQWREAETQKGIAQNNAEESRSLALAANAQLNLNDNNLDLAVALGLAGSTIQQAPQDTILVLDEAAYLPGTRFLLNGHNSEVFAVALHPDQTRVLSGSSDSRLIMWDITTGEQIAEYAGHEDWILSVAFSNDGSLFASADDFGGLVIVWDTETGEEVRRFPGGFGFANKVVFAPDDASIIVGYDGVVTRYDIESGDTIWQQSEYSASIVSIAISPDGTQLATGEAYGANTLTFSDLETGEVLSTTSDVGAEIFDIAYTNRGDTVLLALGNNTLIDWSIAENHLVTEFEGHRGTVFGVATSKDGLYAVTVSDDTFAHLWSLDGVQKDLWRFVGHVRTVSDVVLTDDGQTMITASQDGTLRVWDMQSSAILLTMPEHSSIVANVDFGVDDNDGFSASWDNLVYRRNLETGEITQAFTRHSGIVTGLDYDSTTNQILTSGRNGELLLWNPDTGEIVQTLDSLHESSWVTSVAMSTDGLLAISADNDGQVAFWNLEDGSLLGSQDLAPSQLRDVDISDDNLKAVVSTGDGQIVIYDMATQTEIIRWSMAGNAIVWSVQFTPDSESIVVGLASGEISFFDAAIGNLTNTLTGHTDTVNDIDLSDDGSLLVSGSSDSSLRLWDVSTGHELRRINLADSVISVSLNSDGTQALVGLAENGTTLLVDVHQQSREDLIQWAKDNRYIPDFNCLQLNFYRLDTSSCEEQ